LSRDKHSIEVVTGAGVLKLITLQLAGGKVIDVQDFINAHDVNEHCFTAEPVSNDIRASA
jgi:methionyl-tRNA formyltransferase